MKLVFEPDGKHILVKGNKSLLEALQLVGIPIEAVCAGKGMCGKCKVRILEGDATVSDVSRKHITKKEIEEGIRLACQIMVKGDMRVEVLEEFRRGRQKILVDGITHFMPLRSNVQKYHFFLGTPSLSDTRSDLTRILDALGNVRIEEVDVEAIRKLPHVLREGDFSVTVVSVGKRIVDFERGDTTDRNYGIAFDIGTTTVVGYLLDLESGTQMAVSSMINPQVTLGEDVISRIQYGMNKEGMRVLHEKIIEALQSLIDDLCVKSGVEKKYVYEMTVVGNTCMHHLFLDISPASLAQSPYVPVMKESLNIPNFPLPAKNIFVLPTIAGFVGADTVGCLLASRFGKKVRLLLDIGTNCEVVLGTSEKTLACSTAAGPAFEGAHIKHGMRAASGAIIEVSTEDDIVVTTIDDAPPCGIAGSGLVSALAAMLEAGVMTRTGRIIDGNAFSDRVRGEGKNREFVLIKKDKNQKEITIMQKDVREIQLAKGAVFAAQRILAKEYGVDFHKIESIELAGAFGTFIPKSAAQTIGMIPDFPLKKIKTIGNGAGTGAKMALLSIGERRKAEKISKMIGYVELSGRKDFSEEFMDAMVFPHANLALFPNVIKRLEK